MFSKVKKVFKRRGRRKKIDLKTNKSGFKRTHFLFWSPWEMWEKKLKRLLNLNCDGNKYIRKL